MAWRRNEGGEKLENGYLALVLHAHLPYVRHREDGQYLEERWLYEALTDTYIPLLHVFQGLVDDNIDFHVTMSFTPTLISMLTDPELQTRYVRHLQTLIQLAIEEVHRTAGDPVFHPLASAYFERFQRTLAFYQGCDGNIISAFRALQELGRIECITSAATHAFLPLVATEEAVRAQIMTAIDIHVRYFGRRPIGIWLPECGYAPGIDAVLRSCGIQYFITDTHGVTSATPAPIFGTYAPVLTPSGVAAFARDEQSAKQVWSATEGYPGDPNYREYYRDIGFDLELEQIRPYIHPGDIRVNTGIKYYRITGADGDKEPYNMERASAMAAKHATHFLTQRGQQVAYWEGQMGRKPMVVAPYDAELFGHWWYEGPQWLEGLLRGIYADQDIIKTLTPSAYLNRYNDFQVCSLPMSSWGRGGFADVWLGELNDWIYPALHEAERRMIELANRCTSPDELQRRALKQAARELMLAESSDFAFIMDAGTVVEYAVKRVKYHINRFTRLYQMLMVEQIHEPWLRDVEAIDCLFPKIDYQLYRSMTLPSWGRQEDANTMDTRGIWNGPPSRSSQPSILMLSWEYPPRIVGGLSRHVVALSRFLAGQGFNVHVVTTGAEEYATDEYVAGVHVHRVSVIQPEGGEFIDWAFQLNLAMLERCEQLIRSGQCSGVTDFLVHAHDWLVCDTAKALQTQFRMPLVATIHATEHGRHQGIHTNVQRHIHHLEWQLTQLADCVIVCSTYMANEVKTIFQLPHDKVHVLPNGIDLVDPPADLDNQSSSTTAQSVTRRRRVTFIGRLVREKGVQTLLDAVPLILNAFSDVDFSIAGTGPMLDSLTRQAYSLNIQNRVTFLGFLDDEQRNQLFESTDVAVFPSLYEPFGIVALEAMAAHVPIVVADTGGLSDIVQHGHNGLKMTPGDPISLAEQVKYLLSQPKIAIALADVAYSTVQTYNWTEIGKRTIEIYAQATHHPI